MIVPSRPITSLTDRVLLETSSPFDVDVLRFFASVPALLVDGVLAVTFDVLRLFAFIGQRL